MGWGDDQYSTSGHKPQLYLQTVTDVLRVLTLVHPMPARLPLPNPHPHPIPHPSDVSLCTGTAVDIFDALRCIRTALLRQVDEQGMTVVSRLLGLPYHEVKHPTYGTVMRMLDNVVEFTPLADKEGGQGQEHEQGGQG